MKLVDLFCGCGGLSLGAHNAGFEVAVAYDRDPILTSSYSANFPKTKLKLKNIAWLSGQRVVRDTGGEVDGIFGGPPCQGFSDIGRRDPSDPRRKLLGHFFRIVAEVQPKFFVMENVRGLAYSDARIVLGAALEKVRGHYDILEPHIWDAADFGAATKRRRLFVIGIRKDLKRPITADHVEAYRQPPATVRDAIGDLAGARRLPDRDGFDRWKITIRGRPTSYAKELRAGGQFTGHRPTDHTAAVIKRFSAVTPGQIELIGRHPRLKWDGQCPTLRAGTGSDMGSYQSVRPIHPDEPRVITVREGARLQGFPDDHRFHATVWHSFRMIGNSVSPIIATAIFSAIRDRLNAKVPDPMDLSPNPSDSVLSAPDIGADAAE